MAPRLPNMIIIGAAKAGTTALYKYLDEHPDIFMSPVKETNYFAFEGNDAMTWLGGKSYNKFRVRNLDDYMGLFADAGNSKVVGEASPLYLESPSAAKRIFATIPDVHLLVSLRNPADRAFSAYMMKVRNARESRDVGKAFAVDDHYVQVGFYYEKLKRYLDLFSGEQCKVILFDDLVRAPLSVCQDVYEFLGIDSLFRPDTERKHNEGVFPRNKILNVVLSKAKQNENLKKIIPGWVIRKGRSMRERNMGEKLEMPAELRAKLVDLYRDDVIKLQELIERDLSFWLTD